MEQKPGLLLPIERREAANPPPAVVTSNADLTQTRDDPQRKELHGILEDETAVAARVKERILAGPGARWLDTPPVSGLPARARIKETTRETVYSRQSFMTATSASVYSDHGPEPVGVAYGGEEYE